MTTSCRIMALVLALMLCLAAAPALAGSDPLAGDPAPLPGPQWRIQEARGVSLAIPKNWYGFFYVGLRHFYGWWARKTAPLYTKMEFSLFQFDKLPLPGLADRVRTKALGQASLAGRPALVFEQEELEGTTDARRRQILILKQTMPDGGRLWAITDSDSKLWGKNQPTLETILDSLRIEPFFFVLGSEWRFVEWRGMYLSLPWSWDGRGLPSGYVWQGQAGQGREMSLELHQEALPPLEGYTLLGQSVVDRRRLSVYQRRSSGAYELMAVVHRHLPSGRFLWARGSLRGQVDAQDWELLGPAIKTMLRSLRIDWDLFPPE
ncbi:MAG: hypothetical protein K9K65_13845 [Desulfarculaceae bacterium]|nr:hypothetical protein [Desulfarculaceae bacterium]MCF8048637.1 hypothetical protein [Desulfarculaceae bacterium]MCF8066093.1 hypothetical protein [Desulfarculaceae bacterium]MCF8098919.1 hypothetical protein [Desulfarculaceae bacterium]MCF8121344.1 hypothetical protein [Desulfarculaceae bacterium]